MSNYKPVAHFSMLRTLADAAYSFIVVLGWVARPPYTWHGVRV